MTWASRCHRRVEIALWVLGISLLGVALGATLYRWHYQAQQERALFHDARPADRTASPQGDTVALVASRIEHPERAAADHTDARMDHATAASVERVPVVSPRVKKKQSQAVADPSAVGRIEIPRLGMAAIVREGADEGTLARAVGLIPGSARPGELGNVVLAGHRDTFFRPLRKIKVNDRIRLVVPPRTYEYRVESMRVVTPSETSVLDSRGVKELTLVTCYPFRFIGSAPDRFIVSATRVN